MTILILFYRFLPFFIVLGIYTAVGIPLPEAQTLEQFTRQHPNCLEWSDSCVICQRGAGKISCSTPGIACQPQNMACTRGE